MSKKLNRAALAAIAAAKQADVNNPITEEQQQAINDMSQAADVNFGDTHKDTDMPPETAVKLKKDGTPRVAGNGRVKDFVRASISLTGHYATILNILEDDVFNNVKEIKGLPDDCKEKEVLQKSDIYKALILLADRTSSAKAMTDLVLEVQQSAEAKLKKNQK